MKKILTPLAIAGAGVLALHSGVQFLHGRVSAGLGAGAICIGFLAGARHLTTSTEGDRP